MKVLNLPWERCWCFSTVRSGSIASAIYASVCGVIRIIAFTVEEIALQDYSEDVHTSTLNQTFVATSVDRVLGYVELGVALLLLIAGICLLVGIFKHKFFLLLPFIIMFAITVVLECLLAMMTFIALVILPSFGTIILMGIVSLSLFVDTSCLLCVYSHFMNIRAGRESMRAVYRTQGERLSDDYEENDTTLQQGAIPTKSTMHFSTTSDTPVSNLENEAPPPYSAL